MDRPLLVMARLDGTSTPAGSVDPGSGTNARLLVDCTNNDGALIESIALVQRVADDATLVNLYISPSALLVNVDAFFLGRFGLQVGDKAGATTLFPLWPLLDPVPHAGGNDSTGVIPQFDGLRLARGLALWAAANSQSPISTAPSILVQGGYF